MAVPTIPALLAALGLGGGMYALRDGSGGGTVAPVPANAEVRPPRMPDVAAGEGGELPESVRNLLDRIRQGSTGTVATPRPASPALTPGAAVPAPAAPAETPPQNQQPNERAGDTLDENDQNRTPLDRLTDFGFAMAASRNPSIFGMIGDAGLAMRQADQQARREALQNRELTTTQEYRQAQIRLAEAEAAWQRDPNNPLNVARLAQARAAALRASGGGGGGGEGGGDRIAGQIVGDDGILYGVTRDGRAIPYRTPEGEPFRRGQTENWQAQWTSLYNGAMTRLAQPGSPGFALTPEQRAEAAAREANAGIAAIRGALRRPGQTTGDAGTAPPPAATPQENRVRIPFQP